MSKGKLSFLSSNPSSLPVHQRDGQRQRWPAAGVWYLPHLTHGPRVEWATRTRAHSLKALTRASRLSTTPDPTQAKQRLWLTQTRGRVTVTDLLCHIAFTSQPTRPSHPPCPRPCCRPGSRRLSVPFAGNSAYLHPSHERPTSSGISSSFTRTMRNGYAPNEVAPWHSTGSRPSKRI